MRDNDYYEIGKKLYLKKRKRAYLINHYRYNVDLELEKYYFALLLLFKRWRDICELKREANDYRTEFLTVQSQLKMATEYHEQLQEFKINMIKWKKRLKKL